MAPQELEGPTLGHKHRAYNKILQEQITSKEINRVLTEDDDINNMLKIDVANHNKDVEVILNALQSDDILYVSRALAGCTWLVTDQSYAHIINPSYLQAELFPKMTTKAMIKLKKYIRHHIKNETRAEMFYLNEKVQTEAIKWLPYCSVAFIENNIKNHDIPNIDSRLYKRLCERSITIFEIIIKDIHYYGRATYLQDATFFLNTDIDKYLQAIENSSGCSEFPKFNSKATKLIMKHSPKRVIDNIEKYISMIHIPTFVKYLKVDEIKPFLYCQAKKDDKIFDSTDLKTLFYCDNLQHFIKRLPQNQRYEFVKNTCMVKKEEGELKSDTDALLMNKKCRIFNDEHYIWYQFAPFEVAFEEITKLITVDTCTRDKLDMLSLLVTCADHNLQHVQVVLNYFIDIMNRYNQDTYDKLEFIRNLLEKINIAKCDKNTWKLLNDVLTSAKIYEETSDLTSNHTQIVSCIIIYNILNGRKTSEVIMNLSVCNTFKSYRAGMNQEQKNKVFNYLYEYLLSQLKTSVSNEDEFMELVQNLTKILNFLNDWDKSLIEYPVILSKIKEIIALKKANSWKESLTCLYNVNKSWRKHMFEQSLDLCPNEEVCINSLKHDPELLERHSEELEALKTDHKRSLCRMLSKLRVYWPHTLAQKWVDEYFDKIKETNTLNTVVRSLCTVLPHSQLLDIIEKYKPKSRKIDWKQTDDSTINMQRGLAKNMYRGRPQLTPDAILPYAVGDYLQYALPSLMAMFYNLKSTKLQEYISKLVDAPVSIQKHGIRIAFERLDHEQLIKIFLKCWQTSKNLSIRAIIFKYTFTRLCSGKDPINAVSLWEFLKLLINQLSYAENKDIYKILSQVDEIPLNVRSEFLQKSFEFLKTLITKVEEKDRTDYQMYCKELATYSSKLMSTIDMTFVTTMIEEFIANDFFNNDCENLIYDFYGMIGVVSTYILCSENEENQIQKYKTIIEPLMRKSLTKWDSKETKSRFESLLDRLSRGLQDYVVKEGMIIPLKMFSLIQNELYNSLTIPENYMMLTKWKLTVALAKLLNQCSAIEKTWDEVIAHEFGNVCLEFLKEDVKSYFPCIYLIFSQCLKCILYNEMSNTAVLKVYEGILSDDFIPGYLTVIEIEARGYRVQSIWERVLAHPSVEVKMHYYCKNYEEPI